MTNLLKKKKTQYNIFFSITFSSLYISDTNTDTKCGGREGGLGIDVYCTGETISFVILLRLSAEMLCKEPV